LARDLLVGASPTVHWADRFHFMSLTKLGNDADGRAKLQAWGVPAGDTMLISDQEFADKDVVLDGVEFERCRFTRCKLTSSISSLNRPIPPRRR